MLEAAKITWDTDDLAAVLRKTKPVIHRLLKTSPNLLPPPARRVGKYYLWIPADVLDWLRRGSSSEASEQTTKRTRGRPRNDSVQTRIGGTS